MKFHWLGICVNSFNNSFNALNIWVSFKREKGSVFSERRKLSLFLNDTKQYKLRQFLPVVVKKWNSFKLYFQIHQRNYYSIQIQIYNLKLNLHNHHFQVSSQKYDLFLYHYKVIKIPISWCVGELTYIISITEIRKLAIDFIHFHE